ncbi:hypothetical protein RSOLAG22IIIB_11988 [Rhizoctonia solani]|uniref:Uncharacterized protein n=1 Tax=Rhizoctonia solani TaxID=456999 RepID=A0A0K6GBC6_9AGAM|nr:hypothetical protein RSOLAG22IIIB_11988 [Rhizoctonia solani]
MSTPSIDSDLVVQPATSQESSMELKEAIEFIKNAELVSVDDLKEVIDFIKNADIGSPNDPGEVDIVEVSKEKHNSDIAGASARFLCAMINIPKINQNDVLESLLFSQLVASGKTSAYEDTPKWYEYFLSALAKLGWTNTHLGFKEASLSNINVSVSQVVLDFLKVVGGVKGATRLVDTMKQLPASDHLPMVFNHSSVKDGKSNFQLSTVELVGENIALVGGAFHFDSNLTIDQVLFAEFSSSNAHFFQSQFTSILNVELYAKLRKAIKKRLVGYDRKYIGKEHLAKEVNN